MGRGLFRKDGRCRRSGDPGNDRHGARHGRSGDPRCDRRRSFRLWRLEEEDQRRARWPPGDLAWPDARASGRSRADLDDRTGQAPGRGQRRDPLRRVLRQMVRRGGTPHQWPHHPLADAGPAHHRAEGTGRRLRNHHAVELPQCDDHPQGRAGAGRRLHGGDQAIRVHALLGAGARRTCRTSGHPRRRHQHRHRHAGRDRQRDHGERDRSQDLLHRLDAGRFAADAVRC
jgi:hypothetical protein